MVAPFHIREFYTRFDNGRETDYVVLIPRGEAADRVATPLRIPDIIPKGNLDEDNPSHFALLRRWEMVEPAYKAWKAGQEIPEEGTPLAAWPGVTPEVAQRLKNMACYTVEHVAALGEEKAAGLPVPGARQLPKLAKQWLENRDKAEVMAQNESMQRQIAEMQVMMEEMASQLADKKPRRAKAAATEEA